MAIKKKSSSGSQKFRELLKGSRPILIAGAHNGLTARLVEEQGFDGIWASGFEMSASFGVPDANVLTMTENLALSKQMVDATDIPVIADCDNGYGNAVNVIRMVQEFENIGVAGVCIEDNVFPKRCSFYDSVKRELASAEEHAGKVRAAKEAQRDPNFIVIARTEAMIAGHGMEEALVRANMYADAGADMVLIHSKLKNPSEIYEFAKSWNRPTPLVAVPTIYKETSADELYSKGIKAVIFANHGLRAAIKAVRETLGTIRKEQKPGSVEGKIVSLQDVYDLIGLSFLNETESRYLPIDAENVVSVILAAGSGKELGNLCKDVPPCMLDINGHSMLQRQVSVLQACRVRSIAVVRGYKKDQVNIPHLRTYDNDQWDKTYLAHSLFTAAPEMKGRLMVIYGDVLFDRGIVSKALSSTADIGIVVDRSWEDHRDRVTDAYALKPELVVLEGSAPQSHRFLSSDQPIRVKKIGRNIPPQSAHGEFIGVASFSVKGTEILKKAWAELSAKSNGGPFQEASSFQKASLTDLLQYLIDQGHAVHAIETYKGWLEIDTPQDYERANALFSNAVSYS